VPARRREILAAHSATNETEATMALPTTAFERTQRRARTARAGFGAALLALQFAVHAETPSYRITVVGPLAADQTFVAAALNRRGEVAGTLTDARGSTAAVWAPGASVRRIGHLPGGGAHSTAAAINAAGMVVGTSGAPQFHRAFAWTREGGMIDLGALLPEGLVTEATAVNDAGLVAIEAWPRHSHGFGASAYVWSAAAGVQRIEPTVEGAAVRVRGLNQLGQATGYSGTSTGWEAMIWSAADGMRTLGRPEGWYNGTDGAAINDHDQVVGNSTVGCCVNGVSWTPEEGWRALGYLPNYLGYSDALAVNNDGIIVGASAAGAVVHAVAAIWFPGHEIANLNHFIDPADPLAGLVVLGSAVGINDAGQIVANATLDGRAQAVVLTPQR
jgi:probable HAF family extracellular repeat protein